MSNLKEVGRDTMCHIQDCDVIVVMDGGRVVKCGMHDELMMLEGGQYHKLVAFQMSNNMEEGKAEDATL